MKLTITLRGGQYVGEEFGKSKGIFTDEDGERYLGQFNERHEAHGYGVWEWGKGTSSGEFVDGDRGGYVVSRWVDDDDDDNGDGDGDYAEYRLYARSKLELCAKEFEDGRCEFNGKPCDATNSEFADLKRKALGAEVRHEPSPGLLPPHLAPQLRLGRMAGDGQANPLCH